MQQTVVNYLARNGVTLDPNAVTITNLTSGSRNDPTGGTPSPPHAQQVDQFQLSISLPANSVRWVLSSSILISSKLPT